jgi:hypothetical protein
MKVRGDLVADEDDREKAEQKRVRVEEQARVSGEDLLERIRGL